MANQRYTKCNCAKAYEHWKAGFCNSVSDLFRRNLKLGAADSWALMPCPVQFSAGIDVPQTVFIIVLVLNSSLWLIPAGNSNSSTVHEEPPQMRAPPPLMRDHPSWPVEEQFYVYFGTKLV